MSKRQGNNPKRRITPNAETGPDYLDWLSRSVRYTGSPHHKRVPADYGFDRPADPRPNKSLCDGIRSVLRAEATALFREAIIRGMISTYRIGRLPKYVWAVDADDRVYEAKLAQGSATYHGYELGDDESSMRRLVIAEWRARCPTT
ncbi:MAG: hypothetical protein F4X40_05350 [Chloroflexi bacterium]|nr:hypothetical protein [Chloroflexota bacterium]